MSDGESTVKVTQTKTPLLRVRVHELASSLYRFLWNLSRSGCLALYPPTCKTAPPKTSDAELTKIARTIRNRIIRKC